MENKTEMPIGLGFGLAMNEQAMNSFSGMTEPEKRQVLQAARNVQTKQEMERLVDNLGKLNKI